MPIEIRELIIQTLVGGKSRNEKPAEKKEKSQLDVAEIVSKMMKKEKER